MDFQSHFYVFYQVKQNREKKHKMQGFIQMYNGAFLHNMEKKITKAVKDFSWEKFPKASPAGAPDHRQSPRCAPSVQVE